MNHGRDATASRVMILITATPHGTTVYLPSASITHSNTAISNPATEHRASFTQYFPGYLMRWVDNGFMTDKQLKSTDGHRFKTLAAWKKERWSRGLEMYSTYTEVMASLSRDVD